MKNIKFLRNVILNVLLAVAGTFVFSVAAASGQSVTDFVDYQSGIYTQNFDTLPNPGATSVNTAQVVVINGVTYTLPSGNGAEYALDDTTIGSGGNSIGGTAMAGWYGADALTDRFGATFGDQTTGGLLDFGLAGSGNRALGLIATSTTGSSYLGVAIKNDTGVPISAVNIGFLGELWKQGTFAKTFLYSYTVDNSASLNLIAAATSPTAVTLGSLTAGPTAVEAVDGTNPANQTPVTLNNITLSTPLQAGGILWFTAQIADPTGSGQGFGIDNFTFSAVGALGITSEPGSQTVNAGATVTLSVAAGGATGYQWQFNGTNISGATGSTLTLSNIGTNQAGNYAVVVNTGSSSATSNAATVNVNASSRPINISSRGYVGVGSNILVAGFVISGPTSETVLIRGIGPSLSPFGVAAVLAAPQLTVFNSQGNQIASNSGWGGSAGLAAIFLQVGAFSLPAGSADAALVITLAPGSYTAQLAGAGGGTGAALLEVYDVP
jgi:hypothetical protein